MAQYRLSVNMIGRSSGRSATAAAAYRAASRIIDQETGLVHDYTAKQGVLHTEIISPNDTPDWMHDRTQLWNAVHKVETRKNSQLAREIQLSLPHELNAEQHVNLVRNFVEEQCISRGMIADVAIHAPSSDPAADERNHHAHVMLTTREFVGGAWLKNKNRDWHQTEMIEEWREAWADHQNQALETLGFDVRVDHRSYEDQGVLKEPQMHLGPVASEIERDGRSSYRGNENRAIRARNGLLNDISKAGNVLDAKIAFEKRKFSVWQDTKRGQLKFDQAEKQKVFEAELSKNMSSFEASLDAEIGQTKSGLSRAHEQVANRLQVKGWRKFLRDITFTTRKDKKQLEQVEYEQAKLKASEDAKRQSQDTQQQEQRDLRAAEELKKSLYLEKSLQRAEERREKDGWAMRPGKGVKDAQRANIEKESQNKPPTPPKKDTSRNNDEKRKKYEDINYRERDNTRKDYLSSSEKRREDNQRRTFEPRKKQDSHVQNDPLDFKKLKEQAKEHKNQKEQRRQNRNEDPSDDFEL